MTAEAWVVHNQFKGQLGTDAVDLDGDTFKGILCTSASNIAAASTPNYDIGMTGEVADGSGYTTGGVTLTGVAWEESGGTVTFDCADMVWTASGGDIVARFAGIYDSTPAIGKPIVAHSLLDDTPANVTATDGNTFTIGINAAGVFTLA